MATARALDPFGQIACVPESTAASTVKVVASFAQIIAGTPYALAVRYPGRFLSFLGGLDIINMSVTKVRGSRRGQSNTYNVDIARDQLGRHLHKANRPVVFGPNNDTSGTVAQSRDGCRVRLNRLSTR